MEHSARPGQTSFALYLRTGMRIKSNLDDTVELKFNPYHDLRNGQFTFAPGGARSSRGASGGISRRPKRDDMIRGMSEEQRGLYRQSSSVALGRGVATAMRAADLTGTDKPGQLAPQGRTVEPPGRGGNIRAFEDPMTLQQVFPGLNSAAGGAIVAVGNLLDVFGPANDAVAELLLNHSNVIYNQIKEIDPSYRFRSLGMPQTADGLRNQLDGLRFDRAAALYRLKNDISPLQLETLRFLQRRTDDAYARGMELLRQGKLTVRLSPNEALGNFIDREVRRDIRDRFNSYLIDMNAGSQVRVNARAYDTSKGDRSYALPDSQLAKVAFDVTITRKTASTQQVQRFFTSDFSPTLVVIVRPSQLGPDSSYAIMRPEMKR